MSPLSPQSLFLAWYDIIDGWIKGTIACYEYVSYISRFPGTGGGLIDVYMIKIFLALLFYIFKKKKKNGLHYYYHK